MAVLALGGGAAVVAPASTAHAAGWVGACHLQYGYEDGASGPYLVGVAGWCDGEGPNWHYYAYVHCANYNSYYGIYRWAGDRRQSVTRCPHGVRANGAGVAKLYLI